MGLRFGLDLNPFEKRVGVVGVDGFLVFDFDAVLGDAVVSIELEGDFSNHVFDEAGVFVRFLGDELFVGTFEHGIEGATCAGLDHFDEFFKPDMIFGLHTDAYPSALVVGTILADFFTARAEGGDGDFEKHGEVKRAIDGSVEAAVELHHAGFAGHGSRFFHEEREFDDDMGFFGFELLAHSVEQVG